MGYRAHVNKKRIVEYGEGIFNHCSQELADFLYKLKDKMDETEREEYHSDCPFYIWNDYELKEDWEIEREWLEDAVKYIKENMDLKDNAFDSYTYGDVITNFEYWLDRTCIEDDFSDPTFVYITWF